MSSSGSDTDNTLLQNLAQLVRKHLEIPDDDLTVSKFVHDLYIKAEDKSNKNRLIRLKSFKSNIDQNGGEDFPKQFILDIFEVIDKSTFIKREHPMIKKEPQPIIKEEKDKSHPLKAASPPQIKTESRPYIKEEFRDDLIKSETKQPTKDNRNVEPNVNHKDIHDHNIKSRYLQYEAIEIGRVYKGFVNNIAPFGAFIRLNSQTSFQSGLCHISQISFDGKNRVNKVEDELKHNQQVFVKVIDIQNQQSSNRRNTSNQRSREKISLSMRGIDQVTGLDRSEELELMRQEDEDEEMKDRQGRLGQKEIQPSRGTKRRLTSPERWEIRQLIASGAAKPLDYPELSEFNEDPNDAFRDNNSDKNKSDPGELNIDIEITNNEPTFLKGQMRESDDYQPVTLVQNPEGSMSRAAMNGSTLARDYKDEKLKQQREKEKTEKREQAKSMDSHDPLLEREKKERNAIIEQKKQDKISEWKKSQTKVTYGKRTSLSMREQRETLPVYHYRSNLVEAVKSNQFLIVVGETGSGKTTQIVQYLSEEGFNDTPDGRKIIGCTQPRRVAAVSVANRVADEVGCQVGDDVGYLIRFEDRTSNKTKIKYMTDGMLEREALNDPYMTKYSVIMLDEAHERTIATDVLFALLKKAALKNPNLKIIVTSATLDSDKFSRYFDDCPIIKIPGRTYPVEVLYTREPEMDYLASALDSVIQIHVSEPEGDILVFLTGQEEIETSCEALFERMKALGDSVPELIILPVYSALPSEIQSKIFEPTPPDSRKVILATNIAETSITIDGIYYVIDPGFVKINAYDAKLGMDSLIISPISQAQANQRSGRAGRTGPGKCYRLYTENAFKNEMLPNTVPEIQRQNLSHTILMLKAMGISDLLNFEFMDPPPANTLLTALQDLYTLNALDEGGKLTDLGHKMADFPMEPALAKTLIISSEFGCSEEILTIVAMLSVQTVFYRPKEKQNLADQRKSRFHNVNGDHLTLFGVYKAWQMNNFSKTWCLENFIQERSMRRAQEVRKQLTTIMKRYRHPIVSCGADLTKARRALCAGFFKHSAKKDGQESGYKTLVEQTPVSMHPSSSLFGKNADYVIYHTLLLTTKEYMHCVTVIEPKWLIELAPTFFQVADPTKSNERKKKERIIPLFDKFAKSQDSWRLSSQQGAKKRTLGNR